MEKKYTQLRILRNGGGATGLENCYEVLFIMFSMRDELL